jgi:anti-sigma regulatory factor (Ser/Thr protein kinase)
MNGGTETVEAAGSCQRDEDTGRRTALELRAMDSAVPSARLHARSVAQEWGRGDIARTVELVVSELLTNALLHAAPAGAGQAEPAPVGLRLTERLDGIQVDVWDASPRMPAHAPAAAPDEGADPLPGGRGLLLVKAYSASWGFYPAAGGGKVVWSVVTR